MQSLKDLYLQNPQGKFRFLDWDYQTKYFKIDETELNGNEQEESFSGELDCGTQVKFPKNSNFWKLYDEGDEEAAKAV